jgi:phospho-N-acetylmuramoyl-pentapeptide-transferase
MTVLIAALLGLVLTGVFIQLATRYGWGKTVRTDGPGTHLGKTGTPTMGGLAILVTAVAVWLVRSPDPAAQLPTVALIVLSGALGLYDDVLSLRRKRDEASGLEPDTGLLARYRLLGQGVVALAFAIYAVGTGATMFGLPWLDVLGFAFVVVGAVNALNFTDGLDGLAAGLMSIMLLLFIGSPLAAALLGALLGFLWYNGHPARVFMGGVGSEALGAALAGLAIVHGLVWYLPLVALVPVLEVLSVIVQVAYFRATGGRRLLRMSPLHHHFELTGWAETRVVMRFWVVTAATTALTAMLVGRLA